MFKYCLRFLIKFIIPYNLFVFFSIAAAVTEPWRVELQELAKAAGIPEKAAETPKLERQRTSQYSAATGRIIPPPTKSLSRGNSRAATAQFLSQTNTARDILGQPDNVEDTVSSTSVLCVLQLRSALGFHKANN